MLKRALAHGAGDSTTIEHIRESAHSGDKVIWVVHDGPEIIAGLVLAVKRYPAKTSVVVEVTAGRDMDGWIERIEELLRDYRDLIGADSIEAMCRDGMTRRLMRRGWKRKATLIEL